MSLRSANGRGGLRLRALALCAWAPLPAKAHGQEVLAVFYAQALVVVACLLLAWCVPVLRAARGFALLGCAAGVVVAWARVLGLPRQSHAAEIMAWMVLAPLLGAAAAVGWARIRRGRDGR